MPYTMFKLGECAEKNCRKLGGFKYLAKVVEGVKLINGEEIDQPNEDSVFADYMALLFAPSKQYVIIYSSDMKHIPNSHIFDPDNNTGSFADFYIYSRATS